VANQKGGVGKTTTAVSVAAALAEDGVRVLLLDLDPQGNATTGLGQRPPEGGQSSYSVMVDGAGIEEATVDVGGRGLACVPSSLDLAGAEIELVPAFSRELRLKNALEPVRDRYDVILIDCPPTLGLLTVNALVAADHVLLPIQCEYYALEGVGQLVRSIEMVRQSLNPALEISGVVLTMYDARTRLADQVSSEVRRYFGDRVYDTVIPRTVRLSEAPGFGQPITEYDPNSRGARAYRRLADEIADRLGLTQVAEAEPVRTGAADDTTGAEPGASQVDSGGVDSDAGEPSRVEVRQRDAEGDAAASREPASAAGDAGSGDGGRENGERDGGRTSDEPEPVAVGSGERQEDR
jgi:chromosome partitioning protein